jgi:transcriptional regulator with GAF, ATPase, and Fis domain
MTRLREESLHGNEPGPAPAPCFQQAKAEAMRAFEHAYLNNVMAQAQGNVTRAARIAGKERRAFGKLLKKHGLPEPGGLGEPPI